MSERVSRKKNVAIDDGLCHCSICQFLEEGGETFEEGSGHKCKCGDNFLAVRCWNNGTKCKDCYIPSNAPPPLPPGPSLVAGSFVLSFMLFVFLL